MASLNFQTCRTRSATGNAAQYGASSRSCADSDGYTRTCMRFRRAAAASIRQLSQERSGPAEPVEHLAELLDLLAVERPVPFALRLQRGEAGAADQLAEAMFPPLANFARRSLGDPAASDDVAQETIIRVVGNIHKYRAGTKFRAWVYRIALNICRNKATRKRHVSYEGIPEDALAPLPMRPGPTPPTVHAEAGDEVARVRAALARLAAPFQEIVRLRLYQGLSFREISAALDVPEGTLKSRMHHAVRHMRTLLGVDPTTDSVGSDLGAAT